MYGAESAIAIDIDPNSMDTAYDNLRRNNLPKEKYSVIIGNILSDEELQEKILEEKYDLILANIVADVIMAALPLVKKAIKPDGTFITSGIISDRADEVIAAIGENGFEIVSEKSSADWVELKCKLL